MSDLRTSTFGGKPPLERSRIAAEKLKRRIADFHVTLEQLAKYTRIDLQRLQEILNGSVVMGIGEFFDIYRFSVNLGDNSSPISSRCRVPLPLVHWRWPC